jgi:hypothetical protein
MGLFSTRVIERSTSLVPYEKTVHEHRAPTDQSVALLREMENAAAGKLVSAIPVDFNGLSVTLVSMMEPITRAHRFLLRYDLNGIARECVATVNWSLDRTGPEQVLGEIRKQFADHLAATFLGDFFHVVRPALEPFNR